MKFISYAQNNEDVLLWRALGQVENGFYIDVGANDPVEHSVTKAFYDAGWHGINIEPLPVHIDAFQEQRPRDINLAVAAGSEDGSLTLYDVPAVRGWASPEASVAELHRTEGHEVAELTVPVRTLASVCAEHVRGEIHFLKIDVEGFEGEVLRGMDFARWRPWVLVIEATLPNSRETNHDTWEHLVTSQRYRYAWFDGLNRYYVAEEHPELLQHFGIQPNVFDEYISWHLDRAWEANRSALASLNDTARQLRETEQHAETVRAALHESEQHVEAVHAELHAMTKFAEHLETEKQDALERIARLNDELTQAHASNQQVAAWANDLEQRLVATLNSTSWKVTRPLRYAKSLWIAVRRPGLLKRLMLRATRNQALRRAVVPVLLRHPELGQRVSSVLQAARQSAAPEASQNVHVPQHLAHLPASVRGVLADLQRTRTRTEANT
jgi:FkbM family methyltransferase